MMMMIYIYWDNIGFFENYMSHVWSAFSSYDHLVKHLLFCIIEWIRLYLYIDLFIFPVFSIPGCFNTPFNVNLFFDKIFSILMTLDLLRDMLNLFSNIFILFLKEQNNVFFWISFCIIYSCVMASRNIFVLGLLKMVKNYTECLKGLNRGLSLTLKADMC